MKNFIKHALEIRETSCLSNKEMVENNFIGRGLVFIYNEDKTFDIVSTNTRCFIIKRNVKLEDFDVKQDFLIDLEVLKKDADFKKFMKSNNIVDFTYALENNKKEFDFEIFKNKYKNLKERLKLYSTITDENKIVSISFIKIFGARVIQDFIETLKSSKFFDRGTLKFTNEGCFYEKHNFKAEVNYCISDFTPFSDGKEPEFSVTFSEYTYLNIPTYDEMKGCIYKVDNSKLMYLRCKEVEYDFYAIES